MHVLPDFLPDRKAIAVATYTELKFQALALSVYYIVKGINWCSTLMYYTEVTGFFFPCNTRETPFLFPSISFTLLQPSHSHALIPLSLQSGTNVQLLGLLIISFFQKISKNVFRNTVN